MNLPLCVSGLTGEILAVQVGLYILTWIAKEVNLILA